MAELLHDLGAALEAASRTPLGQRALAGHDEDYEIEISGSQLVHVAIAGRQLKVQAGRSPRREPLLFSRVLVEEPVLRAIIGGLVSPVEAMEEGKLFIRTRLYGGSQITILLRAAYDLARQGALERGLAGGG